MSINTTSHHLPTAPSPLLHRPGLQPVAETLRRRVAGTGTAETVRSVVREVVADLKRGARITTFLPALAEREATRRLQAATPAYEAMAVAA